MTRDLRLSRFERSLSLMSGKSTSVDEPSWSRSFTPRISREPGVLATPERRIVWKLPGARAMGCGLVMKETPVVLLSAKRVIAAQSLLT